MCQEFNFLLTKVSSMRNSLGNSTCFSWNPHTLASTFYLYSIYDDGCAMNSISDKWQFTSQPVLTKVSSMRNSLGNSTCFSWNPHTLAVSSLDSFLGVANRESRPLRWRDFLNFVPTDLQIDAFCTNNQEEGYVVSNNYREQTPS